MAGVHLPVELPAQPRGQAHVRAVAEDVGFLALLQNPGQVIRPLGDEFSILFHHRVADEAQEGEAHLALGGDGQVGLALPRFIHALVDAAVQHRIPFEAADGARVDHHPRFSKISSLPIKPGRPAG